MDMNLHNSSPAAGRPIEVARLKTAQVRKDLQVASAELHLTNAALERHLPQSMKQGDVAHALEQRDAIEEKVVDAADELSAVNEVLHEELAERIRLERELAEAREARKA
jgi:hypothetical protein